MIDRLRALRHSSSVMRVGIEEEPDLRLLPMLVGSGDLVLDVGANYGIYTRHLSELVGAEGRVVALEPIPVTCSVLRKNVERHEWTNVDVRQLAASDCDCELTMIVPEYPSGGENLYMARVDEVVPPENERRFTVRGQTLDSLTEDEEAWPSFIKIDVEGHELSALRGAARTLRECHPALLVELAPRTRQEVREFLHAYGYREYVLNDGELEIITGSSIRRGPNHLFLAD